MQLEKARAATDAAASLAAGSIAVAAAASVWSSLAGRQLLDFNVLRPDVGAVGQVLREAHDQDRPYQVVHFDGQRSARG